jgi:hypothetical protein
MVTVEYLQLPSSNKTHENTHFTSSFSLFLSPPLLFRRKIVPVLHNTVDKLAII